MANFKDDVYEGVNFKRNRFSQLSQLPHVPTELSRDEIPLNTRNGDVHCLTIHISYTPRTMFSRISRISHHRRTNGYSLRFTGTLPLITQMVIFLRYDRKLLAAVRKLIEYRDERLLKCKYDGNKRSE